MWFKFLVVFIPSAILMLFPKYDQTTSTTPATLTCTITLLGSTILYSAAFLQSWPALLLWFVAGKFDIFTMTTICLQPPVNRSLPVHPVRYLVLSVLGTASVYADLDS